MAYKAKYAANGNRDHNGDWFASRTVSYFWSKGTTNMDTKRVFDLCKLNDIPLDGKWAGLPKSGQAGWQGRFRMNAGQKLRRAIAQQGFLRIEDVNGQIVEEIPPAEFMAELAKKHPMVG